MKCTVREKRIVRAQMKIAKKKSIVIFFLDKKELLNFGLRANRWTQNEKYIKV